MITISLKNILFFAYHGLYPEERELGNNFELNLEVTFDEPGIITEIEQTVDYIKVYNLVKQRMAIPTALLETVVQDIAVQLHKMDKRIVRVNVSLDKKSPPFPNMQGTAGVSIVSQR